MTRSAQLLLPLLILSGTALGQLYKGPATGSIPSGASVTTDNFLPESPLSYPGPVQQEPRNKFSVPLLSDPPGTVSTAPVRQSKINLDQFPSAVAPATVPPLELGSFPGIPDIGTSIPPDPYVAAGPNHVIAVVNSRFRIWDKAGNVLKTINAVSWFTNVFPSNGAFDPKVLYDHISGRWVMVWLQQRDADSSSTYLVSVSDDDNPLGTWYNYAFPGGLNGSTPETPIKNWADYEGVGFDKDAIYLTSNQFGMDGNFDYVKFRIIPKAQLYANTGGPVSWTDFWDLRDPASLSNTVFGTRPTRVHGSPNEYFLVGDSRFTTGNYFTLYRIINPITAPSIRAYNVAVAPHTSPPRANQLGGSTILIESGGRGIRNEPVYMDSSLYVVHSVASGSTNSFGAVRYVRINLVDSTAAEDGVLSADSTWYFYPALAVDKDKNVAITYSRSSSREYIGAHLTWHFSTDPPAKLAPSYQFMGGKANYVKDFSSGRNRWGDYNGIWFDPSNQNNFWVFTEYAESPVNTYGTWLLNCRFIPVPGIMIHSTRSSIAFGTWETGTSSDTSTIILYNYGTNALTVSGITHSLGSYQLLGVPSSFPVVLNTYDSLAFKVYFHPTLHGAANDSIMIASDDPVNPTTKITLSGKGVLIGKAQVGVMYGTSAKSTGKLYQVNPTTGAATLVGPLIIPGVDALAVRPSTRELYGIAAGSTSSDIYRISATYGDAFPSTTIHVGNIKAMAFSPGDTLYVGTLAGKIYRVNLTTGDTATVASAAFSVSGLSFRPFVGELWASARSNNNIYKVNMTTGLTTLVGPTGVSGYTSHLVFGPRGELYSVSGTSASNLYSLDTLTAAATLIGASGAGPLITIALRSDSLLASGVSQLGTEVPKSYSLDQNYPNPFNPNTQIRFALPQQSIVTLTIFNIVGQKIATLVDGVYTAGYHEVLWDGRAQGGNPVASGVYFYRLEAHATDGTVQRNFIEIKKMVLLK